MYFNLNENSYFFNLKIPLRYLQPPNYSHVAGPAKKVKSVRKERGSRPSLSRAQHGPEQHRAGGHPHVTHVPSTAPHGCSAPLLGMWDPSPRGNQPPRAASHGCLWQDGILLPFLPSFCPSFFILPSLPSPFLLSFPLLDAHQAAAGRGRSSPAAPVSLEIGAAPAHYPVLRPPWPCCCRTRLFAPHQLPSAVCGVPRVLPCSITATPTPTPPCSNATYTHTPQPLECPAWLGVQCNPLHTHTLQCTVELGVRCKAPPSLPCASWDAMRSTSP